MFFTSYPDDKDEQIEIWKFNRVNSITPIIGGIVFIALAIWSFINIGIFTPLSFVTIPALLVGAMIFIIGITTFRDAQLSLRKLRSK